MNMNFGFLKIYMEMASSANLLSATLIDYGQLRAGSFKHSFGDGLDNGRSSKSLEPFLAISSHQLLVDEVSLLIHVMIAGNVHPDDVGNQSSIGRLNCTFSLLSDVIDS